MNFRAILFLILSCLAVSSERLAADATYLVHAPSVQGDLARYPLYVDFAADADEGMAFFGVDVSTSHPELTLQGTDYSAFGFSKTSLLLDAWQQLAGADFGPGIFKSTVEYETASSHLSPGNYLLGELLVDFSDTGLPVGDLSVIGLASPDSVIGLEVPGMPETFHFVDVDVIIVPEPSGKTAVLAASLVCFCAIGRSRLGRGWERM